MRIFFFWLHFGWLQGMRQQGAIVALTMFMALWTSACRTIPEAHHPLVNTCDLTDSRPGQPSCLPPPGFFCTDARTESAKSAPNLQYVGQTLSLFPSKESLSAAQPVCPPNATRLVQEQDAKDARMGAKAIAHIVGRALTICEQHLERMSRHPDHVLAGWNDIDPETLEAVFTQCTSVLDSLPAIPQYEDSWLAQAAAKGFEEGYGDGVDEVLNRLLALEMAIATVEVAVTGGVGLIEVAVTRGIRLSLSAVRRMPIFIPGAIGGAGAFLRHAPRAVAKVVAAGSSRVLGRNLKLANFLRLPGEFAHHIVAHGDARAKKALDILKRFGIHVDDAVNGVYLPGYKTSPNPMGKVVHGNLHTNAYYIAVERALQKATTQADAIRILRSIAWKLEHGIMP